MRVENLLFYGVFDKDRAAVSDDTGQWTIRQLQWRSLELAYSLKKKGLRYLDKVAVICENGSSFVVAILGTLIAGGVAVLIDPQLPYSAMLEYAKAGEAEYLCISGKRPESQFISGGSKCIPLEYALLSELKGDWEAGGVEDYNAASFRGGYDVPAFIMFSSGSSGKPKGVVLSHGAILNNLDAILDYMKPGYNDIFYICKTMCHASTLTGEVLVALRAGAMVVAMNPVVSPSIILKRLEKSKATILCINPTVLRLLLQAGCDKYDLSSLRLVYTSGAVAGGELLEAAERSFSGAHVLNMYGLTEAGPRVTAQRYEDKARKRGAAGRPVKGVRLMLKGSHGGICASGESGIIHVRTAGLMMGYLDQPEETANKVVDGWLSTGDIGYLEPNGELFILGREDDVIIRGAHKIDPCRVENVVRKVPGVLDCVVFGITDKLNGSKIVCAFRRDRDHVISKKEILHYCQVNLAMYEQPQEVLEWPSLPLTTSGKVSRHLAQKEYIEIKHKKNKSYDATVIIPVFNQIEPLRKTLEFFSVQTYPAERYEIIVVDDGSTDGLKEKISQESWPVPACRIRYVHQENKGRAAARNAGAALAGGKRLIFCDADRFPAKDFVYRHVEAGSDRVLIGCCWDFFGNLNLLNNISAENWHKIRRFSRRPSYYSKMIKIFGNDGTTRSSIAWAAYLVGNSSLSIDEFERAGGFDADFKTWGFEHFEFALRLQKNGARFFNCPQAENFHIPHKREEGFYRSSIENSMAIFKAKHPAGRCELLKDFLFGNISLEQFEVGFGKGR